MLPVLCSGFVMCTVRSKMCTVHFATSKQTMEYLGISQTGAVQPSKEAVSHSHGAKGQLPCRIACRCGGGRRQGRGPKTRTFSVHFISHDENEVSLSFQCGMPQNERPRTSLSQVFVGDPTLEAACIEGPVLLAKPAQPSGHRKKQKRRTSGGVRLCNKVTGILF